MIIANKSDIAIILVNPSHPGNMGAAARAIKNMGLSQMRLVKPQRPVDEQAFARSAGADDILEQAQYYDTLEAAIADCQLVLGTSARQLVPDIQYVTARQAATIAYEHSFHQKVAILFGREHAGLTNEELLLCHYHIQIPCNPDFSSLNLAAAVQIICYEIFMASALSRNSSDFASIQSCQLTEYDGLATQEDINRLFDHLAITLATLDFYDPHNPRRLMPKLKALFNRTHLKASEVNILRGILKAIDKRCSMD